MQRTSQSDNRKRWIEEKKPEEGVFKHWNWTLHTHRMHTTQYQRKRNRTRYIYTLIFSCVHTAHAYTLARHTFKSSSSKQYKQGSTVETFDGAYFFLSFIRYSEILVSLSVWLRIGFRSVLNIFTCVVCWRLTTAAVLFVFFCVSSFASRNNQKI